MTFLGLTELDVCPKCQSRLWTCVKYSAPTGKFHFMCDNCKYTEIKDWIDDS